MNKVGAEMIEICFGFKPLESGEGFTLNPVDSGEGFTFKVSEKMIEIRFGFRHNGTSGGIYLRSR